MVSSLFLASTLAFAPIEKEVTFNGADGLALKGTLLLPADAKTPVPGVLLLPGSGPTDRNGNQPPVVTTDLLKQVAERLASEGVASLRFDKRAARVYAQQWPKERTAGGDFFAFEKFVEDARAAWDFMRSQKEVDPKRAILAGHSEGGLISSQIAFDTAGKPEAPNALILMGTAGRTYDLLVREQVTAGLRRAGMSEEAQKPYLDYMEQAITMIKAEGNIPPNPPAGLAPLFNASAVNVLRVYFTLDPTRLLSAYEGPVLLLQGERDVQILADRDLPALESVLRARAKGSVESFVVPGVSHNFKPVADPDKEPGFTGPVAPAALDKLVAFVKSVK